MADNREGVDSTTVGTVNGPVKRTGIAAATAPRVLAARDFGAVNTGTASTYLAVGGAAVGTGAERTNFQNAVKNAKVGDYVYREVVTGNNNDKFHILTKENYDASVLEENSNRVWSETTETTVSNSGSLQNHAKVYISMDMHKLTVGSDLDATDKAAGGLADPGFDGIGIDDVAEGVWGKSAADVRYDGDFGVASVALSYGDNAGDAEWAAGFNFNVDPVKIGAGFDSNGVISVGMGFTQGQISMNALYSTDSDHDEADNEYIQDGTSYMKRLKYGTISAADVDKGANKPDLKNTAMGVDVSYQMTEATSLIFVAAQHSMESADLDADVRNPVATGAVTEEVPLGSPTDPANPYEKNRWVTTKTTVDAFGVGFSHDLGGGATLKAGAGSVDSEATADLGITMKF